jgi:biopolymer transport protein ExbD
MIRLRDQDRPAEPELIPVMNLVCLLIPFLMLTATFVEYAVIDVTAPRFVPGPHDRGDPGLELTVLVTDRGFTIGTRGQGLEDALPTLPLVEAGGLAGYDYEGLRARLRSIKEDNEGESTIRIAAERNIPLETVVRVMDATRGDAGAELFPDVILLAGVI